MGPPLDAGSTLRRRLPATVRVDRATAHIRFADRTVTFPAAAAPALSFIVEHDEFRVASLSGISEQSRLAVTRRLVLEGLLDVVGRTAAVIRRARPRGVIRTRRVHTAAKWVPAPVNVHRCQTSWYENTTGRNVGQ